MDLKDVDQDRV